MIETRARKVALVADDVPEQQLDGPDSGDLLVVSWGGPYGACATAVHAAQHEGKSVSHCHLRYLNPFPRNLKDILGRFSRVLIPEINAGQLRFILRAQFLLDAEGLNKMQGKPFTVSEIKAKIDEMLA